MTLLVKKSVPIAVIHVFLYTYCSFWNHTCRHVDPTHTIRPTPHPYDYINAYLILLGPRSTYRHTHANFLVYPYLPPSPPPSAFFLSKSSLLSIFLFPNILSVFAFSISAIWSQFAMRDRVPSLLTTRGPILSSLIASPPTSSLVVVEGSRSVGGGGRGRGA